MICLHDDKMPPSNSESLLCEILKRCSECVDSNNSAVITKKNCYLKKQSKLQILLPDVNRLIELFAIEIEVKLGQNLNGSPTMCSIELLSKFKVEINVVAVVDFNELQRTLKMDKGQFIRIQNLEK